MKKIIFILTTMIPLGAMSQCVDMSKEMKEVCAAFEGKRIGSGVCFAIIDSATRAIGANEGIGGYTGYKFYYSYKHKEARIKKPRYITPKEGDVLLWNGASIYHIAVIVQVLGEGDFMIVHQNSEGGPPLSTAVIKEEWHYKDIKSGSVDVMRIMKGDCVGIRKRKMFHVK